MLTCLCVGMSYVYMSISSCPYAMWRCVYVSLCHMSTCLPLYVSICLQLYTRVCLFVFTSICGSGSTAGTVEGLRRCGWRPRTVARGSSRSGRPARARRMLRRPKASTGACGADWGHVLSLSPSPNSPPTWGPALARLPIPCTPAPAPRHTSPPPGCSRPRPPHTRHAPLPLPVAVGALVADSLGHLDPGALCSPLGKESPQGVGVPRWG